MSEEPELCLFCYANIGGGYSWLTSSHLKLTREIENMINPAIRQCVDTNQNMTLRSRLSDGRLILATLFYRETDSDDLGRKGVVIVIGYISNTDRVLNRAIPLGTIASILIEIRNKLTANLISRDLATYTLQSVLDAFEAQFAFRVPPSLDLSKTITEGGRKNLIVPRITLRNSVIALVIIQMLSFFLLFLIALVVVTNALGIRVI